MSDSLPVGHKVGEYCIQKVLGRGGFGVTYLAEDTNLGFLVAIKEYFPLGIAVRNGFDVKAVPTEDPDRLGDLFTWGRHRFLDEGRTLARFRHPHIVRISRLMEENNTAYLVMDFEKGRDVNKYLEQLKRRPTERELLDVALALLDGLALVHGEGYLHRDIKPGNIVIRDTGSPVLLDFGAARNAVGSRKKVLTVIVSPGFTPVEQYSEDSEQGPWTDIYALGAVLYWATVQARPPDALQRLHNAPMAAAAVAAANQYSRNFLEAIDWALQVEPQDRPQTIQEWRDALVSGAGAGVSGSAAMTLESPGAPASAAPASGWRRAFNFFSRGQQADGRIGSSAVPSPGANASAAQSASPEPRPLISPCAPTPVPMPSPAAPVPHKPPVAASVPNPDEDSTVLDEEVRGAAGLELTVGSRHLVCGPGKEMVWIGRGADCDLLVENPIVSRRHLMIQATSEGFVLSDVSRWGSYVDESGRPPRHVHNDKVVLPAAGRISLGRKPTSPDAPLVMFRKTGRPR